MKSIKVIENSINNLKSAQLSIDEMSSVGGGKCLFVERFLINDTCICDVKDFL